MNARLEIRFARSGEATTMRAGAQDPPWRVIRGFSREDGSVLAHLHNVSGGVLAGDELDLDIAVDAGVEAQVTTTGATRLYRHRAGSRDSAERIRITVGEGGVLEYLPDPVIPFRGSRHEQHTAISLAQDATLFWWETLAPGRHAMGEQFAFERLRVRTRVESPAGPLLIEDFLLEPGRRNSSVTARMGPYLYASAFYALHVGREPGAWRELESALNEIAAACSRPGCTIWGASALAADGVAVRGLSTTAREIPAALARFWNAARLFLTGRSAIPPRKLK